MFLDRYYQGQSNLSTTVKKTAIVAWLSVSLGLVLPGVTSYCAGTLYDADVREKLPEYALEKQLPYERRIDELKRRIERIETDLNKPPAELARSDEGIRLLRVREEYAKQLELLKPPIHVQGFFLDRIMLLWPSVYFALGLLVYVLPPYVHPSSAAAARKWACLVCSHPRARATARLGGIRERRECRGSGAFSVCTTKIYSPAGIA